MLHLWAFTFDLQVKFILATWRYLSLFTVELFFLSTKFATLKYGIAASYIIDMFITNSWIMLDFYVVGFKFSVQTC